MTRSIRSVGLSVLCCSALLVGCGGDGGGDEEQVKQVAIDFTAAFASGDNAAACELMSDKALEEVQTGLGDDYGTDCPETVGMLGEMVGELEAAEVTAVRVSGETAEIEMGEMTDGPMKLRKVDDAWLVDSTL